MPVFTPDGTVRLLSVPFDSELRNTLWFPDRTTQTNYWLGRQTQITYYDVNYVKKDNALVVPTPIDQTWQFNYCMYQNSNFTDKWFYAFIVVREWASNNSTRLYLRTDPLQTWMFDWVLKTSFVSRQHSTTDVAGDNIVPEPVGGSIQLQQMAGTILAKPDWYAIYATTTPTGGTTVGGINLGGIYSGCGNVFMDSVLPSNYLNQYVENGTASAVARIQQLCGFGNESGPQFVTQYTFNKYPTNLDGYTPKNNKLLSGAFCRGFLAGFGHKVEFTPDFCGGSQCYIRILQDFTSGALYAYVSNEGLASGDYENMGVGFQFCIPESTWAYNQYKNDYNLHSVSNSMFKQRSTQQQFVNSLNAGIGAVGNIAGAAGTIVDMVKPVNALSPTGLSDSIANLTGNAQGLVNNVSMLMQNFGGYDEISQQLAAISESYNAPATGAVAQSNAFLAAEKNVISYGWEVPDARFAKQYDDFLTVYGYAQNQYMVPNLHARQSWTYIKVAELMADCNCPDDDEVMIKAAFNRGIFFWSYTANYGDFSQNNGIV